MNFSTFRIEEAEAQCALLNSESLCVSRHFFTISYVRIILCPLEIHAMHYHIVIIKHHQYFNHHYQLSLTLL
jgi:hypothetical protein